MNITEIAEEIAREFGISKAQARRIFDFLLDTIRTELRQGRMVKIRNFGTFKRYETVDGKCIPKFYASKNFFENEENDEA
jgi:nucleoid DNA-binding protein